MVVCKNHDAFNPNIQRPKSLRRIDYVFYFGGIPFDLQTWAALEVTLYQLFARSSPLQVMSPLQFLVSKTKMPLGRKNDMVDVAAAVMQV